MKSVFNTRSSILSGITILVLLLTGIGHAEEELNSKKRFEVKLSGGMNYLLVGDDNESTEGETDFRKDMATLMGVTMEGEFKKIHLGLDLDGDVIVYLIPQFGISVGLGYIYGKKGKDASKVTTISPIATVTRTMDTKASAIPVRLGVYYSLRMSSKARFFLNVGAGYYFAKWSDAYRRLDSNGFWYTNDQEANASGIGFHGGVGFEYDIFRNVAFVVEGYGRHAKISGFEGDQNLRDSTGWSDSEKGTLYYLEWQSTITGGWYPGVEIRSGVGPNAVNVRNVREAKVDFSGFAIRAGIKIKLF